MNKRFISSEDLYDYRWVSDPSVHPASGAVAYVLKEIDRDANDYRMQIRLVSADGAEDKPLTEWGKEMSPAWSPDGSRLAFIRAGNGGRQVWIMPAEGGEAWQATTAKRGVGAFAWSPDGRRIVYATRVSEEPEREALTLEEDRKREGRRGKAYDRTLPRAEGSGWWDGLYSHLFVLDTESGETERLTFGEFDASHPVWSPDGGQIGFLAKIVKIESADADRVPFNDVFTVGLRHRDRQPVRRTNGTLNIAQFAFSPDGRTIAMIGDDRKFGSGTMNRIYAVSLEDAAGVAPFSPETDVQIANFALGDMKTAGAPASPAFDPSGDGAMYALGTLYGSVHVFACSRESGLRRVTRGERDAFQFALSPDGRTMVVVSMDAAGPGELYRVDVATGEETRLTRWNDELMAGLAVSAPEEFRFVASDGCSVQGWILKPPGLAPGQRVPMVLQIHGGPHAMYSPAYSHELQTMAAGGYAVLFVNPRGSFGYGQEFARACRGDFGGVDYRDLMEAVDAALERFDFIDADRLGVTGGSYGGLMTNWIVAKTNRFRAAVSQRSISNWLSFYGTSDIGISYTEGIVGGNPWDDHALLWDRSPLAHANRIEAPLLILHGEQDFRCPIEQADQLYAALKRLGKTTRLIRYPGSGHLFLKAGKPSYRAEALRHIQAWFDEHLAKDARPAERGGEPDGT